VNPDMFSLPWRERVLVRGKKLGTLTSIPPVEGEEVNFTGKVRVVEGVDRE